MTTSTDVPGRVPVAINGHGFMAEAAIERTTVPVIRQQADTSTEAGEQTLNPQGLWRRSQESWHHGAGQDFLDGRQGDQATDPHRFRSSKGIDCWTKGQVSLLHPTMRTWQSTGSNLHLTVASLFGVFYLLVADGTEVYYNTLPYGGINSLALQQGTGWTATNATIAASGTVFRLTSTSAAVVSATSPTGTAGVPVDPGRQYSLYFRSLNISGAGGGRSPQILANWYTAAGAFISSSVPIIAGGTDATATTAAGTLGPLVAPANAAYASVTISYTAAWANGDVHEVQSVNIAPTDLLPLSAGPDSWTPATINAGQAAQTVQSLVGDGITVWAALGTSGLHRWTPGGGAATADVPAAPAGGQISLAGYANGFLLAAGSAGVTATLQNSLWLVTDPLGTPALSLIKTHPNTSFQWTGISPGRSCVYAYGNNGGNGEVYKILFDPNTGSLSTAASPATYLPDGETIHALAFYAGGIIMGTGKGLRLGTADGAGNIDYGPLIPTEWPVRCIEPQDRYCWFGWTKYDTINSGLGRVDLGFLTDTLTPAWASDLMTSDTSGGNTLSCVTLSPYGFSADQRPPVRVFTVAAKGVYIEDPNSRVPSGMLETGTVRFSTSEPKTTRSIDVRHHALPAGGPVTVEMQRDSSGTWEAIGSSSTTGSYGPATPLSLLDETAEAMEFRFTLDQPDNNAGDYSRSPEVTRWTAKVLPLPSTVDETFTIPIIMRAETLTGQGDGTPYPIDVAAEIAYLKGLERTRTLIDVQIGEELVSSCYVAGSQFKQDSWSEGRKTPQGIYLLSVNTARG